MQMIIGGKHVDASNGKTSQVVNPATGQVIDTVPEATLEDLDRAIGLAVEGQKEWNAIPLHQRLAILETYCQLLTREETVEKNRPGDVRGGRKTPLRRQAQRRLCGAHGDRGHPGNGHRPGYGGLWPGVAGHSL